MRKPNKSLFVCKAQVYSWLGGAFLRSEWVSSHRHPLVSAPGNVCRIFLVELITKERSLINIQDHRKNLPWCRSKWSTDLKIVQDHRSKQKWEWEDRKPEAEVKTISVKKWGKGAPRRLRDISRASSAKWNILCTIKKRWYYRGREIKNRKIDHHKGK